MSAPSDQSVNEMESENEPITNQEASNTSDPVSENRPVVNEEANTSESELENRHVTDELASANPSTNVISTSSRVGFSSLPRLLQLCIHHTLLIEDAPLTTHWPTPHAFPVVNKEEANTSESELENPPVTDEIASANPSTTNDLSTSSRVGFFSLPPEIRVLIYRHLLVEKAPVTTYWPTPLYSSFPDILRTCRLIRREAFPVMYGENTFFISFMHPRHSMLRSQRISDTIQNVGINLRLYDRFPTFNFLHVIREFGSPAIVRATLSIVLRVNDNQNGLLPWVVRAVPRFSNFRMVQIDFIDDSMQGSAQGLCLELCNMHRDTFTPVLGPSVSYADGRGLRFLPQDFLNSLPPAADVGWMDLLNGVRQNWNQDPPHDESEP